MWEKNLSKWRALSVQWSINFGIILEFTDKIEITAFTFLCHASVSISHTVTPGHLLFHLKLSCYTGSWSALVQHTEGFISPYAIALGGTTVRQVWDTFKNTCCKCDKQQQSNGKFYFMSCYLKLLCHSWFLFSVYDLLPCRALSWPQKLSW